MNTTHTQYCALLHSFSILAVAALLVSCSNGNSDETPKFEFSTATKDRYVRVDRTGEPALATALLSRETTVSPTGPGGAILNPGNAANTFNDQRDALNRGDPVNDARDFAGMLTTGPQSNSLRNIHYKLGPALRALGLTPCSTEIVTPPSDNTQVDISVCVAQAAPVILPDVITFDVNAAPGWPNGRSYDDPVVDRLLAASLLRISGNSPPHTINTLVGVINPIGDETGTVSPFKFPHLRPAHP